MNIKKRLLAWLKALVTVGAILALAFLLCLISSRWGIIIAGALFLLSFITILYAQFQ